MVLKITDYLDQTVQKYPHKIAYIDDKKSITFEELRENALCIANELVQNEYCKRPILLYMEKSVALITSFIGIAYSGNFYSPVDTKMPKERINRIIETLKPAVVITNVANRAHVEQMVDSDSVWIYEDLINAAGVDHSLVESVAAGIIDTDILYVLFTSGSTGTPKGVIINHRAAIDFIEWISQCYNFNETTVFGNQAQLYFDLSIQDVFAPLRNGSTTVLIPNRLFASPVRVWKRMLECGVNTIVWIPSMISMFANLDILNHVERAPLKAVLFCGEVMPVKQLNYWINAYPNTVFANLYGPTECTEACTYYTIDRIFKDDEVLPIGKPCENCDAIVVNDKNELISKSNEIGELLIRGTCLSDGYYGNRERTEEVFIQNPLNSEYPELVYKTGDLVCYNDRSELVYVCRKDFQIKIRGYRVELGEIESAVSAMSGVLFNCCLFDPHKEELILVYVGDVMSSEVKIFLESRLQEYMIPTRYIQRKDMPFNLNGKVDRKALQTLYITEWVDR